MSVRARLVGSFPHGVVDDVEALSKLALSKGVGLHVDNCLGGFLLSSVTRQKLANVSFDFKVPGVTSISVDIHKYGFAAKGASCICYRDTALRQRQYTTVASWSGGLYCTPTFQGSRSGALMAAAWSTMLFMGQDGYDRVARNLHDIHTRVRKAVESIPGLKVQHQQHATPHSTLGPLGGSFMFDVCVHSSYRCWATPSQPSSRSPATTLTFTSLLMP